MPEVEAQGWKIGFIGVDYLTLMKAGKADRNDIAYGEITKGLKQLAKELDTTVVLLTQLNRKLEDRTNKRPMQVTAVTLVKSSRTAITGWQYTKSRFTTTKPTRRLQSLL